MDNKILIVFFILIVLIFVSICIFQGEIIELKKENGEKIVACYQGCKFSTQSGMGVITESFSNKMERIQVYDLCVAACDKKYFVDWDTANSGDVDG